MKAPKQADTAVQYTQALPIWGKPHTLGISQVLRVGRHHAPNPACLFHCSHVQAEHWQEGDHDGGGGGGGDGGGGGGGDGGGGGGGDVSGFGGGDGDGGEDLRIQIPGVLGSH